MKDILFTLLEILLRGKTFVQPCNNMLVIELLLKNYILYCAANHSQEYCGGGEMFFIHRRAIQHINIKFFKEIVSHHLDCRNISC